MTKQLKILYLDAPAHPQLRNLVETAVRAAFTSPLEYTMLSFSTEYTLGSYIRHNPAQILISNLGPQPGQRCDHLRTWCGQYPDMNLIIYTGADLATAQHELESRGLKACLLQRPANQAGELTGLIRNLATQRQAA